jgi:hypothetical protein
VASPVRFSHGRGVRKQQVHFNDLQVSGRAVAHSMIVRAEDSAEDGAEDSAEVSAGRVRYRGIELLEDLLAAFRMGVVGQAHRRPPR